MPATSTSSPSPTGQTQAPAYFVSQQMPTQMAPASKSISESPVLSTPQSNGSSNSSAIKPKKPVNKKLFMGIGAVVVVLLIIGGGAGIYLSQTNQDTRQQASTPTGTARITLSPTSGVLRGDTAQTIPVSLDLSSTPVSLTELTFVIAMSGQIPADLQFQPESLTGFNPADVTLEDVVGGKTLTVSYTVPNGSAFTSSTAKIGIGSIKFTNPNSGQLILRFQASDSKAIVSQSGADILRPPSLITYTFQSSITPTPPTNEVVNDASDSAVVASSSATTTTASTSAQTRGTGLSGVGGGSATASAELANMTKTPTPTPTKSTTLTPTPTSSRSSSQPATTQEKPVSGSVSTTYTLIAAGFGFILFGLRLTRQKPKTQTHEMSADN